MSSPGNPRPWNAYGEVRGLKAPARSPVAPARFTARAVSRIWASLSTAHGPATIGTSRPPTAAPPGSLTTVGSARHSRATIRYGRVTWTISSTPGSAVNRAPSTRPSLSTTATKVRWWPSMTWAR